MNNQLQVSGQGQTAQSIVFRQHRRKLYRSLAIDFLLLFVMVGFFTVLYHILKYLNLSITLTERSLIMRKGTLSASETEVPYSKVNSVTVRQSTMGKAFNYGDIIISTGNDVTGVVFDSIENPHRLKEIVGERS